MVIKIKNHLSLVLFLVFSATYFLSTVGIMNSNDAPGYALTQAIVENHSTRIDNFRRWSWPDIALVDNHYFSIRPPGLSIISIPFYVLAKLFRPLAGYPYAGKNPGIDSDSPVEALTIYSIAVFGALSVVMLYKICITLTRSKIASLITSVSFGLGSLNWKYSSSFQRHALFILILLSCYYLILIYEKSKNKYLLSILLGVLLGFSYITESIALFIIPIYIFFIIIQSVKNEWKHKHFLITPIVISMIIVSSILHVYNFISFGKTNINLYNATEVKPWMNYSILFSSPLYPNLILNLFSNSGLPYNSFSQFLKDNPIIFANESAGYAMIYPYKGIFSQSPYLYLSFVGFFFFIKKYKLWSTVALSISFCVLILMTMYLEFYSPNTYDSRFFLPIVPFLSIGTVFFLNALKTINNIFLRLFMSSISLWLICASILNGWYSNISNFAPHITGEHRFDLSPLISLIQENGGSQRIWSILIENTFPNIYNFHLLVLYSLIIVLVYFGFVKLVNK